MNLSSKADQVKFDGCSLDKFGVKNNIRTIIEKAVSNVLEHNKGICFCHSALKDGAQFDIMKIKSNKGETLGQIIANLKYKDSTYRTAIYKYFLREYLCYYEAPTVKKKYGEDAFGATYDKFLITSNPVIVASWMNMTIGDAVEKYCKNLISGLEDNGEDLFPYVKLVEDFKTGEHKVTKPRAFLDLAKKGTRIYPAFAFEMVAKYLYDQAQNEIARVSFLKDGGEVRVLDFTFDKDKLEDIYGECEYVRSGLNTSYTGDIFEDSTTLQRGYIKVVEVGNSRYDFPTRNISIARVGSFEFGVEPDLTFINIDVSSSVECCVDILETTPKSTEEVKNSLIAFELITEKEKDSFKTMEDVINFIKDRRSVLTSLWDRQISLYMLANPDIFPTYDGQPKKKEEKNESSTTSQIELNSTENELIEESDDLDGFNFDFV